MAGGTRFRLFPQLAQGWREPELVEVSLPPGAIGPGPQDARMYVANAVDKPQPYDAPERLPPYDGPLHPDAMPGPGGHFDHIPEETPQFLAAHLYGSVRRVLDIWEGYLGHRVAWWHAARFPRLELVPLLRWGNAQSGFGFLEMGLRWTRTGKVQPLCLNFDVVAHEVGHAILFSVLGGPAPGRLTGAFLAFHEAFSDLVAAFSALHFRSVEARLLQETEGNLYALNLVSRLGELSDIEQVRVLDNEVRLADLEGVALQPDGRWADPLRLGRRHYFVAAPVTGAVWDCFVELFQDGLVARRVIAPSLDARGWDRAAVAAALAPLQRGSAAALARRSGAFVEYLREARDLTSLALAHCLRRLDPDDLCFEAVAARFVEAMDGLGQAHNRAAFEENFLWRGIGLRAPGGRVAAPDGAGPPALPRDGGACPACRNPFAVLSAGRLLDHRHREAAI